MKLTIYHLLLRPLWHLVIPPRPGPSVLLSFLPSVGRGKHHGPDAHPQRGRSARSEQSEAGTLYPHHLGVATLNERRLSEWKERARAP